MNSAGDDNETITRFRARLDGVEHEVEYRPGEVLLDCMLDAGLDPPYQCHDAQCGSCMVRLRRGEVKMRKRDALSKRDLEQGYILLCQAEPLDAEVLVDCDD